MTVSGLDTALGALIEHAAALSSRDDQRCTESLSVPFVHLWQDGEILRYEDSRGGDLLGHFARAKLNPDEFGHTEVDEASLILDWDELKAFYVRFTRYSQGGDKLGQSEAIWVVTRVGRRWKLKLRIGAARVKDEAIPHRNVR
jgi:hypothetical protein